MRMRAIPSSCLGPLLAVVAFLIPTIAWADTLEVGPGKPYATPCGAIAAAAPGDVIEIDAVGEYDGDVCIWPATAGLTVRGVEGRPHIDAAGENAGGKGVWVVTGDDIVIENVEISGATVPDQNGAAIRLEGTNLTLRGVYFHDNENGLLAGDDADSEILIEFSEFAHNGYGDGYSHNMYVNHVKKFTLRYSYSHHAVVGHNVKTRALENLILYNRIMDEADGNASYAIDVPNGGTTHVIGNLIQQGPASENGGILAYAAEGASNPSDELYVVNNTFVNDDDGSATFVAASSATTPAVLRNNVFVGDGTITNQADAVLDHNFDDGDGDPMLVDRGAYDYRLQAGSPCVEAGADPGTAAAMSLMPEFHYVHPAANEGRTVVGTIDIGAYELEGGGGEGGDTEGGTDTGADTGASTSGGEDGTSGSASTAGTSSTGSSSTTGTGGTSGAETSAGSTASDAGDATSVGSGEDTGTDGPSGASEDEKGCACIAAPSIAPPWWAWLGARLLRRRRSAWTRDPFRLCSAS